MPSSPPVKGMRPKVSPDGRYFVDQNGTPVFWLGTTQWQLVRDFKQADVATILQKTKEKVRFAQVMLLGVGDSTRRISTATTLGQHRTPDSERGLLQDVDDVLRMAGENDVVISLTYQSS